MNSSGPFGVARFSALATISITLHCAQGQITSGSDGRDGAFRPTKDVTVDMRLRPDGIYHFTEVNVPQGVTVTFTPNERNTPVTWLVSGDCVIGGTILLAGQGGVESLGGLGGPGGWSGGNGGSTPSAGRGPGGGSPWFKIWAGGNGSFATVGGRFSATEQGEPGKPYGNNFILPLMGGSGGGAASGPAGGGGGGGAILIACSRSIEINGSINAEGGSTWSIRPPIGGAGSGGSVRLVANKIQGKGSISARGGSSITDANSTASTTAGHGWVRFDCLQNDFGGSILGSFTQGLQPIVIPEQAQGTKLMIESINELAAPERPSGQLLFPDILIPPSSPTPTKVVVRCTNVPLNTPITVTVRPASGNPVSAVALNTGRVAESTATVIIPIPAGGGIIYATAQTPN